MVFIEVFLVSLRGLLGLFTTYVQITQHLLLVLKEMLFLLVKAIYYEGLKEIRRKVCKGRYFHFVQDTGIYYFHYAEQWRCGFQVNKRVMRDIYCGSK